MVHSYQFHTTSDDGEKSQRRAGLDVLHSMDGREGLADRLSAYQGKTRDDLLEYVRKFHERISSQDEGLWKALKKVMKPEDWNSLHTPPQ
ncbi:hypothetical protein BJV74DRAFT_338208 [Russula compacta]|nr:hypothetical protein BJV74DRAFT_338208 [Russula compacta]